MQIMPLNKFHNDHLYCRFRGIYAVSRLVFEHDFLALIPTNQKASLNKVCIQTSGSVRCSLGKYPQEIDLLNIVYYVWLVHTDIT